MSDVLVGQEVTAQEVLNDVRQTERVASRARDAQAALFRRANEDALLARRNVENIERQVRRNSEAAIQAGRRAAIQAETVGRRASQSAIQARNDAVTAQQNYLRRLSVPQADLKVEPEVPPEQTPLSAQLFAALSSFEASRPTAPPSSIFSDSSFDLPSPETPRVASANVGPSRPSSAVSEYRADGQLRYLKPRNQVATGIVGTVVPYAYEQPLTYPLPSTVYPTRYGPLTVPDYYIKPLSRRRRRRQTSVCCSQKRTRKPSYRKKLATRRRCRDKLGRFVRC